MSKQDHPLHLKNGDPRPPLEPGKLRLYSMRFCPFAQRTRLVLEHKKIAHEVINVNLKEKPDWMCQLNPLEKVPILEHDGKVVYESVVCNDYLDEVFPGNKLNPDDPYIKAKQRMLLEHYSKVIGNFYKLFRKEGEEKNTAMKELYTSMDVLECALTDTFFGGNKVSMIDYFFWPWFERMNTPMKVEFPEDRFPRMKAWISVMMEDEACKATFTQAETMAKFVRAYMSGDTIYDGLD